MSRNADGGAGHRPDAPATRKIDTATKLHDHQERSATAAVLVGLVRIMLGGPAAAQDRAMLNPCPFDCGAVHVFYVPAGAWRKDQPIIRAPRCAPHRRMRLEVVDVLPAPGPVAGQRKRGGA
jgi:hypothetical protein